MLYWSKTSSAPRPEFASALRVRARRYSCSRRKSTRSSKSTCMRPGACSGRSQRWPGSGEARDVDRVNGIGPALRGGLSTLTSFGFAMSVRSCMNMPYRPYAL